MSENIKIPMSQRLSDDGGFNPSLSCESCPLTRSFGLCTSSTYQPLITSTSDPDPG